VPPLEGCRLPPESASSSGCPLTLIDPDAGDLLPSLHGRYPTSTLLRSSPPLAGASVLSALWGLHLRLFPYHRQLGLEFHTKAGLVRAMRTKQWLQMRRNGHKESEADRGTRLDGKYFRTKKMAAPGAGSTGENEPSGLSTESPVKNRLRM